MAASDATATARASRPAIAPFGVNLNFDLRAISILEGLRATVVISGLLAVAAFLHVPILRIAALGGLLACLSDPGGPISTRLPPMLIFGLIGSAAFFAFPLLLHVSPALAVILASAAIFGCALARIYGQGGAQTGMLASVAIVLSLDKPVAVIGQAAMTGAAFWFGAVIAAALTAAIWRFRPYAPARVELSRLAAALAAMTRDLEQLAAGTADQDAADRHAAAHRRAVREAIERTRGVLLQTFRSRGAGGPTANQLSLRFAAFDQIFEALIGLGETLSDRHDADSQRAAHDALRRIGGFLAAVAPDLAADRKLQTERRQKSVSRLRRDTAVLSDHTLAAPLSAIAGRLAVLLTVSSPAGIDPARPEARPRFRERVTGPLRANLTWNSMPFRHALRIAVVVLPMLGGLRLLHNPFGHWLAITVMLTLQPYAAGTATRAIERIGGTVVGGLVAAGIGLAFTTPLLIAAAMVPLNLAAFALRAVNYALFLGLMTPMLILLIEQIIPGTSPLGAAIARVGFTIGGGIIAVVAHWTLWPSFERTRLRAATGAAIEAHQRYLAEALESLGRNAPPPDAARRAAGLASNNLEASIARALSEPARDRYDLHVAIIADAALRRIAGRLVLLALERDSIGACDDRVLADWARRLERMLGGETVDEAWPEPPATLADSLQRLRVQADLVLAARKEGADGAA